MQNPNKIKKAEEIIYQGLMKQLRDKSSLADDLQQIKETYNIQENRSLLNKYRDMKKGTAQTLNVIDKYCDYFEKYKNLVLWEDPKMSKLFFCIVIAFFMIVTFFPMRLIIFTSFTYRFYKG